MRPPTLVEVVVGGHAPHAPLLLVRVLIRRCPHFLRNQRFLVVSRCHGRMTVRWVVVVASPAAPWGVIGTVGPSGLHVGAPPAAVSGAGVVVVGLVVVGRGKLVSRGFRR